MALDMTFRHPFPLNFLHKDLFHCAPTPQAPAQGSSEAHDLIETQFEEQSPWATLESRTHSTYVSTEFSESLCHCMNSAGWGLSEQETVLLRSKNFHDFVLVNLPLVSY